MTNLNLCLGLFGLGIVLSTSLTGCPAKDAQFDPLPEVPCTSNADCDDGNACTTNTCDNVTLRCIAAALDGVATPMAMPSGCVEHGCQKGVDTAVPIAAGTSIAAQIAGDCRKVVCDGTGSEMEIDDNEDVKIDGLECTLDVCTGGMPTNPNAPKDSSCGINLACDGNGKCVGCSDDVQCSTEAPACAIPVCNAGVCQLMPKPNGTMLPLQDQTAEDCKARRCDGAGNVVDGADPNDPKNDGNDCTADTCNGMTPFHSPVQAGVMCNGGGICDGAGHCLSGIGDLCAADADCSSDHCVDAVCCDTVCSNLCMSCNVVGNIGTCSNVPFPGTDGICDGTQVCNGNGLCLLANGQSCNPSKKCASGICKNGVCKSTIGQPCAMNQDCVSGICTIGVCE